MNSETRVSLVVPCYNEASRLDVEAMQAALVEMSWLDLLLVNDGSTDQTATVLAGIAARWPSRVRVLSLEKNCGKAEAVRRGLLLASSTSDICGFWDADLSAPLFEVATLRTVLALQPATQWAWAIRLRSLGRRVARRPLRHYLGRVFATVASTLLGVDAYDTQCGAKLFRVTPLLSTVLSEPFLSRWIFDVEMLSRAAAILEHASRETIETVVYEQPLSVWRHQAGSKVGAGDFISAFGELIRINRERQKWRRPLLESIAKPIAYESSTRAG